MPSQIQINDITFHGFHGVYEEEHRVGTPFRAHVIVTLRDDTPGFHTDRLEDTVNYEEIIEIIRRIGTAQPCQLVEHLVQRTGEALMQLPFVEHVDLTLSKFHESLWISVRRVF